MDDLSIELHGSKYFTLIDARSGYGMHGLDRERSLLTTFNTHWEKLRRLQLPFGLSVSSDTFHERQDAIIKMVSDVTDIKDTVLAKGGSKTNHDIAVLSLPDRSKLEPNV